MAAEEPIVVFFGIEIADHAMDSEILQIYMKYGEHEFNRFVTPTKEISEEISRMSHLSFHDSVLYRNAEEVDASPIRQVLKDLHAFLKQFGRPCTLIAHKYCYKNGIRLIRAMKREMFAMKFNNVIAGFTSSLDLYVNKFPERDIKELTIHKLKKEAGINWKSGFNTGRRIEDDTGLLEQLVLQDFGVAQLAAKRSFAEELKRYERLYPGPKPSGNKFHPRIETVVYVEGKSSQKNLKQQPHSSQKENVNQQISLGQEAGSSNREIGGTGKKVGDKRQRELSQQADGDQPVVSKKGKRKATKKERKEMRLHAAQEKKSRSKSHISRE